MSADSNCKSTTDYEADFDALNSKGGLGGVKRVRTYAVVDNAFPENLCQVASAILPAAKAKGFQVILGLSYVLLPIEQRTDPFHNPNIHVDRADTKAAYDSEKATLATVLTSEYSSTVYALTVGSESLYREVDACELLPRIVDARSTFGNIVKRVGTVDSWNKFADGTADPIITGNCDGKASVPGITFLYVWTVHY